MDTDLGVRIEGSLPPEKCFEDPFDMSKLDIGDDVSPNSSLPPEGKNLISKLPDRKH